MTKESLERAVARLKSGDMSAFDCIYDGTSKVVFFVVHNIVRRREIAEDIVQDTYVSALGHLDSYDGGSFLAWLTTIAKRTALNAVKKNAREIATDLAENEAMFAAGGDPAEGAGLIAAAEKLLPPDDYEIVIMCAVAGYRRREVAKIKGMPVSTVSHRYKSALSKLKKYLEEEERQ